jgi:hypothetical protein
MIHEGVHTKQEWNKLGILSDPTKTNDKQLKIVIGSLRR